MSAITSNNREQVRTGGSTFQDVPVVDRAREMVGAAADKVEAAATSATKKVDQAAATAGSNIRNFADNIKDRGPQEGMLGDATKSVAGTIEAGGKYLEEQGVSGILDDMAGVIKRNPVPAILAGVGLGILIARAFRS